VWPLLSLTSQRFLLIRQDHISEIIISHVSIAISIECPNHFGTLSDTDPIQTIVLKELLDVERTDGLSILGIKAAERGVGLE